MVLAAVAQNGKALRFASQRWQAEKDVVQVGKAPGTSCWVNYNDLTVLPSPGIMVNKRDHPKMALFQVCDVL
jgi:hypothetical protein